MIKASFFAPLIDHASYFEGLQKRELVIFYDEFEI